MRRMIIRCAASSLPGSFALSVAAILHKRRLVTRPESTQKRRFCEVFREISPCFRNVTAGNPKFSLYEVQFSNARSKRICRRRRMAISVRHQERSGVRAFQAGLDRGCEQVELDLITTRGQR